jgi:hypothetical protein
MSEASLCEVIRKRRYNASMRLKPSCEIQYRSAIIKITYERAMNSCGEIEIPWSVKDHAFEQYGTLVLVRVCSKRPSSEMDVRGI